MRTLEVIRTFVRTISCRGSTRRPYGRKHGHLPLLLQQSFSLSWHSSDRSDVS